MVDKDALFMESVAATIEIAKRVQRLSKQPEEPKLTKQPVKWFRKRKFGILQVILQLIFQVMITVILLIIVIVLLSVLVAGVSAGVTTNNNSQNTDHRNCHATNTCSSSSV